MSQSCRRLPGASIVKLIVSLLKRSVLLVVGLPVVVIAARYGGWWLLGLLIVLTLPAMGEYYGGVRQHGGRPASAVGYVCAVAMLVSAVFADETLRDRLLLLILFFGLMLTFLVCFDRRNYRGTLHDTAVTLFGLVYIALMMTFFARLRDLDLPQVVGAGPVFLGGHVATLLLVLLPAWALDTFAYVVGKLWGQRRLAPVLSPGKTMEGAIAGFLGSVAMALVLGLLWVHLPWTHALALGCLIGIFGQVGDLAKSALKRDIGLKDFGTMFGPHGGVLDRFDDLLFVVPLSYFYLWLVFFT